MESRNLQAAGFRSGGAAEQNCQARGAIGSLVPQALSMMPHVRRRFPQAAPPAAWPAYSVPQSIARLACGLEAQKPRTLQASPKVPKSAASSRRHCWGCPQKPTRTHRTEIGVHALVARPSKARPPPIFVLRTLYRTGLRNRTKGRGDDGLLGKATPQHSGR